MLRRNEKIAPQRESEPPGPARYEVETAPHPPAANDRRMPDRRQTERRGMDRLRAEALQSVIARVEDRNFGGIKEKLRWPRALPPSRLALVAVALIAAGAAAWLASQPSTPAPTTVMPVETAAAAPAPAPTTKILVAKTQIGVGDRLSATAVEWQAWPDTALRPEFITATAQPAAPTDMAGSIARDEFFPGEPILSQKLSPAGGGYLSSVLEKGMRGVSVNITADSASGGFVVPNDHVDVVLTRASTDQGGPQKSDIILHDVRVLAINTRLGATGPGPAPSQEPAADGSSDASSQAFVDHAIATLELDPTQSQVIINATNLGKLSLMLRPTGDTPKDGATEAEQTANAAIRLSSPFWTK